MGPNRPPELVLSIDLGSTWCKAGYLDREGRIVAEGRTSSRHLTAGGGAEEIEHFWTVVQQTVIEAGLVLRRQGWEPRPVAIGLSCRGLFGIFLDSDGRVLPASGGFAAIKQSPDTREVYSSPLWAPEGPYAYSYAPRLIASARWYRREHPEYWSRVQRVGALHDWLLLRLTGHWVTDLASGPGQDDWPEAAATLSALPPSAFPQILDGHRRAGALSDRASADLDVPAGIPVMAGYHDGAAAGIGVGAIDVGDTCLTFGTNLAYRPVTGRRLPDCFGYLIVRDRWAWVDSVPGSAAHLEDVARMVLDRQRPVTSADHGQLAAWARTVPAGANGICVPTFARGEQPRYRAAVAAAQTLGRSPGEIYRAMMEAIALSVRGLADRAARNGARPRRFIVTGGAVTNRLFVEIVGSMLNVPIALGHPEAGLLGAGIGAMVGIGWYESIEQAISAVVQPGPIVTPDPAMARVYREFAAEREPASE